MWSSNPILWSSNPILWSPQLEQMQQQRVELQRLQAERVRLGAGELIKVSQELTEERTRAEDLMGAIGQLEETVETGRQEVEMLR